MDGSVAVAVAVAALAAAVAAVAAAAVAVRAIGREGSAGRPTGRSLCGICFTCAPRLEIPACE